MTGVAERTGRVRADAAVTFHKWRSESARTAGRIPETLLEDGWVLFEPFCPSGRVAKASQTLICAALVLPLAVLAYGFVEQRGAPVGMVFVGWGTHALAAMYALIGIDAAVRGVAWIVSIGLPRLAVRRRAALAKVEVYDIALALSPRLLGELDDAEVRDRAARWALLQIEASEKERLGQPAARLLRRGVAPSPGELELLVGACRSVTVGLYCCGLACLWWPLFRLGMPGWMRLPEPHFPLWPAAAIAAFAAAAAFHWSTATALRLWLGCAPERLAALSDPLLNLSRARRLRQLALEVLTDPSSSAISGAGSSTELASEPPSTGVLGKIRSWLFAEE